MIHGPSSSALTGSSGVIPAPPTVSIVMPVGRIEEFLPETLASIRAQTLHDFELVMVCDESFRSNLLDLLQREALDFPWRVVGTALRGFTFAVNLGIAESTGEFIARWDADDLCDARRLQRQVEEFRKRPRLAVLGTRAVLVDVGGRPIPKHYFRYYETDHAIRKALKYRQPIVHSSLMVRRAQILEWGGYRFGYASEDHAMYLWIARCCDLEFANISDVACYYRRHDDQASGRHNQYEQFCDISGFMTIEFLRTMNPLYIIGALANLPVARNARRLLRAVIRLGYRLNFLRRRRSL